MIRNIPFPFFGTILSVGLAWAVSAQDGTAGRGGDAGVSIQRQDGKLRVEINGREFTEYVYRNVSRPFFYPLIGPGNAPMTRNWPMKAVENEEQDHPHHRSLWYAHGAINGQDFWSEGPKAGKTVHDGFLELRSGLEQGVIKSRNKLIAGDGTLVATDERTVTIYNRTKDRLLDFEITIQASNGDLTFGDTKEGTLALRLAETMRLKGKVGQGHIINSEGIRDGATWGKRARWVDYYGPVDGKTVGIAIFDHPLNPRHPTWWHVRDYGLFAANPFGLHDFENDPDTTKGNFIVPAGKSVTFRYRFYLHEGDEKEAGVAQHYEEYAQSSSMPSQNSAK